jgi:hypothetical protein
MIHIAETSDRRSVPVSMNISTTCNKQQI